jgi:hypothetical protein
MSLVPISSLPNGGSGVSGADIIPLVQGGATKRATLGEIFASGISIGSTFVDVRSKGAKADNGSTDNSTPFANANTAVASTGGVIFVPQQGKAWYGFGSSGQIVLSPGVDLIGEGSKNSYTRAQGAVPGSPLGSILGITNTTNKFLIVGVGPNRIKGINFWYPNQTETNPPITYPATIGQPGSGIVNDICVTDCVAMNPYDFIDMSGLNMGGLWVSDIHGTFLHRGIIVDKQTDWVKIQNIFDHMYVWPSASSAAITYMKANSMTLYLGACAAQADNIIGYAKNALIRIVAGTGGDCAGHFSHLGNDDCLNAVWISKTANAGVTIDQWTCATTGSGYPLYIDGATTQVQVSKLTQWGTGAWGIINVTGGVLSISDSVLQLAGDSGAMALDNCQAYLKNVRSETSGAPGSVSVGSGMASFQWLGGRCVGTYANSSATKRVVAVQGLTDV